jgi:hydrogenase maturation protein HypF
MKHILNVNPKIVACDYHPDYVSTRYAFKYNSKKVIQVQHHHAHIVACMVENRVKDPVIGLAFDGTGIGIDNTIWGSEVLIADYFSFERVACLETVPMPGGTIAIQEPWRMAVSYLYEVFGDSLLDLNLPIFKSIDKDSIKVLITMIQNKINTPNTSSLGRFFDGIAAILGVRNKISFEGQAAIEFEALADNNVKEKYNFIIDEKYNLLLAPIVNGIVIDSNSNISIKIIAAKFHNTIIEMFCQTCLILKQNYGIRRVALSGGVFQNTLLLYGFKMSLEKKGFEVLTHNVVPFNDGSISLGQAVVASYLV